MSTENATDVESTGVIPAAPAAAAATQAGLDDGATREFPAAGPAQQTRTPAWGAPSATAAAPPAAGSASTLGAGTTTREPGAAKQTSGPRRVRLVVSRVDPWSVMKLSFLLSIAIGIAIVVAVAVLWNVLNTMQVFTQIDGIVTDIAGTESFINVLEYVEFSRVMSIAVVVAVVDIVIITALATLFAFLYNVVSALVGGLHVTLTDE